MTAHLNALPAIYSRQGGVGTSGMLTLRDPQTMTTDLHAEVGWSRPRLELDRVQRPASGRRMASHRPGASRASGHLGERAHGAPARRGGAVDPVEDKAHVAVAPLACDRPSGGRQGRDLRLSVPCPIRVQQGPLRARFRWSGPGGATPSGAVSSGSNPAESTGQRHKIEHFDNLEPNKRQACDLRQRGAAPTRCPIRAQIPLPDPRLLLLSGSSHSRPPGPFGGGRPLLLPLCCSDAATADTVPWLATTCPRQSCARPGVARRGDPWQRHTPCTRRFDQGR